MILNLTQHSATAEQVAVGVVEPQNKEVVKNLLNFETTESLDCFEREDRAQQLATIAVASGAKCAMIGGAPFFMSELERALSLVGISPVYAFSKRESVDAVQPDGSVRKTAVFRHLGFVTSKGFEVTP